MRNRFLAGAIASVAAAGGLLVVAPGAMASGPQGATKVVHRWHDISAPPGSKASAFPLSSVFCFTSGECLAVGNRGNADISRFWTGTRWLGKYTRLPDQAASASCATASSCMAVGQVDVGHELTAAAEHWNGTSWSVEQVVLPTNATFAFMDAVSCPAANFCIALGGYLAGKQPFIPIAEQWNGKGWAMQNIPGPPRKTFATFSALSCPSVRSCVAVGSYQRGAFGESWNGVSWTARLIPQPGQATAEPNAISCTSATSCLAVGDSNEGAAFAAHWNGKKWGEVPPITPKAGGLDTELRGVSCASATDCEAVGFFAGMPDNAVSGLAERWNGKKWFVQPTAGFSESALGGVSCLTPVNCIAVGSTESSDSEPSLLAFHYS
jgi:hypothetical protein